MSHARALGLQAWQEALAASDFSRFRDALERQVELRHRYVACFEGHEHPYDALLDDFEPGLTVAELRPLFAELRDALVPLVAATGDAAQPRNDGVFAGPYAVDAQRAAVLDLLDAVGYDPDRWRLDPAIHPFAQALATSDVRITTKYDEHDFGVALYSVLHEFGHGLYESATDPALARTTLAHPVSLGVHESQSRLWENIVGRSRPFCAWLLPRLREQLGGFEAIDAGALYRAVNTVQPSLIRIEADETTYNLHIILRFELELALIEGSLAVDDLPGAWNEGMAAAARRRGAQRRRGRAAGHPLGRRADRLLPDVHDRQPDGRPAVGAHRHRPARRREAFERGDFAPLREWLREHVHRHGRKYPPRELLLRATGEELRVEPFLGYLRAKLADAGLLTAA